MMKKLVSFLLAITLIVGLLPLAALAADGDEAGLVSSAEETATAAAQESALADSAADAAQITEEVQTTLPAAQTQTEDPTQTDQPQADSSQADLTDSTQTPDTENTYEGLEDAVEELMLACFGIEEDVDTLSDVARLTKTGYVARSASSKAVAFIKQEEGFCRYPVWDVSQWTIGYGSRCPNSPYTYKTQYTAADFSSEAAYNSFVNYQKNGISDSEAQTLLMNFINNTFSPAINSVAQKYNIALTQNQFDALLDFSYQLGTSWTGLTRLRISLTNGYHQESWTKTNSVSNNGWYFINAMGTWCHVSTSPHPAVATRRILDLEIFTHGAYYTSYTALKNSGQAHYTYLFFDPNGGSCTQDSATKDWATTNRFYFTGSPYTTLMTASRSGYRFDGWYTAAQGGTKITADTLASLNTSSSYYAGRTVYAHWTALSSTGYTDVSDSDWYADFVEKATKLGIFTGYDDGSFRPEEQLTRAVAVELLYRISGEKGTFNQYQIFSDVDGSRYYANAVGWAAYHGIVNGVSPNRFAPDQVVTREQLMQILYLYTRYRGNDISYDAPCGFTDFDRISNYAVGAMCWAVSHGLIEGETPTTLAPQGTANRAQASKIYVNYVNTFS